MPAAAVIPAPIAYIKVVAVKKLVVGFRVWCDLVRLGMVCTGCAVPSFWRAASALNWVGVGDPGSFTLKKLECLKQAYSP